MLLYVKEIRALQVRISLRLPGVDGIRVDGGPNFGFGDVIFITFQDAGDRSEFSQHIRDHHVLDLELGRGVNAIAAPVLVSGIRRGALGGMMANLFDSLAGTVAGGNVGWLAAAGSGG